MLSKDEKFRSLCRRHGIKYKKLPYCNAFVTFSPIPSPLCQRHGVYPYDIGDRWLVLFKEFTPTEELPTPADLFNKYSFMPDPPTVVTSDENDSRRSRIEEIMANTFLTPEEKKTLVNSLLRSIKPEMAQLCVPQWRSAIAGFAEKHNWLLMSSHQVTASLAQIKNDLGYSPTQKPCTYYEISKYSIREYLVTDVAHLKPGDHWWIKNEDTVGGKCRIVVATKRASNHRISKAESGASLSEAVAQLLLEKRPDNGWYEALKQYAFSIHGMTLDMPKYQATVHQVYRSLVMAAKNNRLEQTLGRRSELSRLSSAQIALDGGRPDVYASYMDNDWLVLIPWASEGGIDWNTQLEADEQRDVYIQEWMEIKEPYMQLIVIDSVEKVKMWCKDGVYPIEYEWQRVKNDDF